MFELVFFLSSSPSACHGSRFYPHDEGNAVAGGRNAFRRLLHSAALVARAINSWSISAHIAAAAVDRCVYTVYSHTRGIYLVRCVVCILYIRGRELYRRGRESGVDCI